MIEGFTSMPGARPGAAENRRRPPAGVVAAAEQDYHEARDLAEELIAKARELIDAGWSDFEAAIEVYASLRAGRPGTVVLLISAVALVRVAKLAPPELTKPTVDEEPS